MGTPRYSRHNRQREERADHLAQECNGGFLPITINDLIDAGFRIAEWRCRRPGCYHYSERFRLTRCGRNARPYNLRWLYVCSECGTKGPQLHPIWGSH